MNKVSVFLGFLVLAGGGAMASGCTSERDAGCPPCEAAAGNGQGGAGSRAGSEAPKYYALPGLDHGLLQSPVNILSDATEPGRHRIEFHGAVEADDVVNLGSTVELHFGRGITTELDGKVYEFRQLHFHTPAEHLIDGVTYPMEMHLVHSRTGGSAGAPPSYLVIALLVKMGQPNRFLAEFLDAIPSQPGQSAKLHHVFLGDAFPPGLDLERVHYYHYRGSLTTPPYTESVDWLVAKEIIDAGPAQIQRINLLEGNNARHVQALYSREIDE
ncbi:MAG: carbonic anhydrase family protein [Deltaproteobacteria bacterium]|nr:carbonic anhydrase family protein [Deltaproteobacteria bacterium]